MFFELEILYFIQDHIVSDTLNGVMVFISSLGNYGAIWLVTAFLMIIFKKTRKCGVLMLCALTLTLITGEFVAKNLIARVRPCNLDLTVNMLIDRPNTYSFPSGHSASSFTASMIIASHFKKSGIVSFLLATLIAFSRMYLFVHYPTDVLGGIYLGIVCAVIVMVIYKRFFEEVSNKKELQNK